MSYAFQWIRSLIFIILMYLAMAVIGIGFAPWALFSRRGTYFAMHLYCRWVFWSAHRIINLKTEIRGTPPTDEVLLAAKHQSFLDIIMIFGAVPRGKFIMKRSLIWAPFLGQYAKRIGCIFVDRGKRSGAIKKMVADVKSGAHEPGQLIIFPQGTRVAVGKEMPYKIGTGVLYKETGQECVPVATNVGVFWRRHGIYRDPGVAVIEFLPRIQSGLSVEEFMPTLKDSIETASDRLAAEAGYKVSDK